MNPVDYVLDQLVDYYEGEGDGSGRYRLERPPSFSEEKGWHHPNPTKLLKAIPGHDVEPGAEIVEGTLDPHEGTLHLEFIDGRRIDIYDIYKKGVFK